MPIKEGRTARREISVKPERRARYLDDPTNRDCFTHALARTVDLASRQSPADGSVGWQENISHASSRPDPSRVARLRRSSTQRS